MAPEIAEEDPNSYELIRVWAAKGAQHVSLNWSRVGRRPQDVGDGVGTLSRPSGECLRAGKGFDREQMIRAIRAGFNAELDCPTQTSEGKVRNRRLSHRK